MVETIKKICLKDKEREICGLIVENNKKLQIVECENIAPQFDSFFEIHYTDFIKAESRGRVVGMYHSHPEDCSDLPSMYDYQYAEVVGYFNLVYIIKHDRFEIVDPDKKITEEFRKQLFPDD